MKQPRQRSKEQQHTQKHAISITISRFPYFSPSITVLSTMMMLLVMKSRGITALVPVVGSRTAGRCRPVVQSVPLQRNSRRLWSTTTPNQEETIIPTGTSSALYLPNRPLAALQTVAAPMVAASDYPFRCLCRQYGVDLGFSQMLHARNLLTDATFLRNHIDFYEYSNNNEEAVSLTSAQANLLLLNSDQQVRASTLTEGDRERYRRGPLIVQLAGHDVDTVVRAAQFLYDTTNGQLDGVDLNLGCPQGIARKVSRLVNVCSRRLGQPRCGFARRISWESILGPLTLPMMQSALTLLFSCPTCILCFAGQLWRFFYGTRRSDSVPYSCSSSEGLARGCIRVRQDSFANIGRLASRTNSPLD